MGSRADDKRRSMRIRQEFVVGVRSDADLKMAYTIDVSRGGVKVGSPQLLLSVGTPVEFVIKKGEEQISFAGKVARYDGPSYIKRISRTGHSFFIKIDDELFSSFISDHYFV